MKQNYDFSRGKRGAIDPVPRGMTKVTVPLDDEILDWFREQVHAAGGGNYLTLINNALKEHVKARKEPIEDVVRRVIRQELSSSRGARKKVRKPHAEKSPNP